MVALFWKGKRHKKTGRRANFRYSRHDSACSCHFICNTAIYVAEIGEESLTAALRHANNNVRLSVVYFNFFYTEEYRVQGDAGFLF